METYQRKLFKEEALGGKEPQEEEQKNEKPFWERRWDKLIEHIIK